MDVEAFEDGYIAKILVQEGDTATVGAAVALIAPSEAEIAAVAAGGSAPAATAAAPADATPGKFKTPERLLNPKPQTPNLPPLMMPPVNDKHMKPPRLAVGTSR